MIFGTETAVVGKNLSSEQFLAPNIGLELMASLKLLSILSLTTIATLLRTTYCLPTRNSISRLASRALVLNDFTTSDGACQAVYSLPVFDMHFLGFDGIAKLNSEERSPKLASTRYKNRQKPKPLPEGAPQVPVQSVHAHCRQNRAQDNLLWGKHNNQVLCKFGCQDIRHKAYVEKAPYTALLWKITNLRTRYIFSQLAQERSNYWFRMWCPIGWTATVKAVPDLRSSIKSGMRNAAFCADANGAETKYELYPAMDNWPAPVIVRKKGVQYSSEDDTDEEKEPENDSDAEHEVLNSDGDETMDSIDDLFSIEDDEEQSSEQDSKPHHKPEASQITGLSQPDAAELPPLRLGPNGARSYLVDQIAYQRFTCFDDEVTELSDSDVDDPHHLQISSLWAWTEHSSGTARKC